ncbi:MAG: NADH-quinone oxidoreductase subunit C [Gammaproteobacteria bacterium]|nr:NADH-quinone oxidoreductase subunit C [Gammaproteobacteria bacterium]
MSEYYRQLGEAICTELTLPSEAAVVALGELTLTLSADQILTAAQTLRDHAAFRFEQLIDACGMDYSSYSDQSKIGSRYAVVYHLLSITHNHRLRLRVFAGNEIPRLPSLTSVWHAINWFEREAFDLFGILFEGHPDLRRILTDYGFIGHPLRKDFPVCGHVEMRYDADKGRVVYEPISLELRNQVPRVLRDDHRYLSGAMNREQQHG